MLLDTSILVEIDRGTSEEKLAKLEKESPHSISSTTRAEFFTGVRKRKETNEDASRKILHQFNEIPFKKKMAEKAGELIARKQQENLSTGINDIYIAATAIQNGKKVLTKDPEDFREIEELELKQWKNY